MGLICWVGTSGSSRFAEDSSLSILSILAVKHSPANGLAAVGMVPARYARVPERFDRPPSGALAPGLVLVRGAPACHPAKFWAQLR